MRPGPSFARLRANPRSQVSGASNEGSRRLHGAAAPRRPRRAKDGYQGPYLEHQLARTYALVGEQDKAIDALAQLLRVPYWVTRAELRIDPSFASLRNNPKFQALLPGD
jgi:hypothetical protein